MRSRVSASLTSVLTFLLFGTFAAAAAIGCAGVKPVQTSSGNGGSGSGKGGTGGISTGNGGSGGPLVINPISGSFTCSDFSNGSCIFNGNQSTLDGGPSGSTTIAYPLNGSLFPSNLGPIQIQSTNGGTTARINFQTMQSSNVSINYYAACETGSTLPVQVAT